MARNGSREQIHGVGEAWIGAIFFRNHGIGLRDRPSDAKVGIVPKDPVIMLARVIIRDLVDDLGIGFEGDETMRETDRDEQIWFQASALISAVTW